MILLLEWIANDFIIEMNLKWFYNRNELETISLLE